MLLNHDFETHASQVLVHFPRLLSLALMDPPLFGAALDTLVAEVAPLDGFLHRDMRLLVDKGRFPSTHGAPRGEAHAASDPGGLHQLIARLDRHAVGDDRRRVREIADGCILLLAHPTDRRACERLAASARLDMSRLSTTSIVRTMAAAAGLPPFSVRDLTHLIGEVAEEEELEAEARASVIGWIDVAAADRKSFVGRDGALGRRLVRDWLLVARHLWEEANYVSIGLHALAAGYHSESDTLSIPRLARTFGEELARPLQIIWGQRASQEGDKRVREATRRRLEEEAASSTPAPSARQGEAVRGSERAPDGTVIVCPELPKTGPSKSKDVARGYERVIGYPLSLVPVPDLSVSRATLLLEFPHYEAAIDRVLRDLVGKRHVEFAPLLLRGPPGVGKSRFVRRLGEVVGVGVFRVDGSNDASGSFGGTERRWYSTEPNRPFMACARFEQANPMVLIDEVDKAATRSDYGRLWDSMLQFMERETASRFQDPCMQVEMDLSHVSIVATANRTDRLPGPLLDRFSAILDLPAPTVAYLPPLAAHLGRDIARERGWDERFVEPFDGAELDVMRRHWRGGSVRRLRRIVETVLRGRERAARERLN